MTTRQLLGWQRLHARRAARAAGITRSWLVGASIAGALFVLVSWRGQGDVPAACHTWLGATIVIFAVAFLRVPALLYWRPDAVLLAQLPIDGRALQNVALLRCIGSASSATAVVLVGAVPLLALDAERVGAATRWLAAMPHVGESVPSLSPTLLFLRHAAIAAVLGVIAATLIPAVAMWSASIVATGRGDRAVRAAVVMAGSGTAQRDQSAAAPVPNSGAALLGAVPGATAAVAIAVIIVMSPWMMNRASVIPPLGGFIALVALSMGCLVAVRATAAQAMPAILREMAALDRHQLATLELNPPTAIERGIASLLRRSAVPFRKDAQLMRRRYPMAFALGALAFVVLMGAGLARRGPESWLIATLVAATAYGAVLARRLWRPPVELAKLSSTLPFSNAARARAKLAWLTAWVLLFIAIPAAFAWLAAP